MGHMGNCLISPAETGAPLFGNLVFSTMQLQQGIVLSRLQYFISVFLLLLRMAASRRWQRCNHYCLKKVLSLKLNGEAPKAGRDVHTAHSQTGLSLAVAEATD